MSLTPKERKELQAMYGKSFHLPTSKKIESKLPVLIIVSSAGILIVIYSLIIFLL